MPNDCAIRPSWLGVRGLAGFAYFRCSCVTITSGAGAGFCFFGVTCLTFSSLLLDGPGVLSNALADGDLGLRCPLPEPILPGTASK
jgi:hypothetical protein